jgi:hypothetical protein
LPYSFKFDDNYKPTDLNKRNVHQASLRHTIITLLKTVIKRKILKILKEAGGVAQAVRAPA